ncbi:LysR family transcriptional regulator [Heliobacterium gestii]|uniref:LysR family transcriptional regulator n=1 Tax=Heliomicrobium gestii TaxID=2699 RepID=A0A845LFH3_HELGE|nr:LysR family transcriptional regulator [Heliomicrobium gestii]MBM7867761.1 DNA-binding transcriptional LysR family regulator [Heliomicrobium gestii]MZP44154.1 LysR family transcriptional regulator [Heliomicrobium gestii]
MNRYLALIKIMETGSFTKTAEELGYTQSAISQMIHSLEKELSTLLILRSRKGVTLTPDGEELLPYIKGVYHAYRELMEKHKAMQGLQTGIVRIGTFSSVSSNWLPGLMKDFKQKYPSVVFELHQGEYTSIALWIKEGSVDFGFVNPDADAAADLNTIPLQKDEMLAVIPRNHPLTAKKSISLQDLVHEPFILLDEGQLSEPLEYFKQKNLQPNIQYRAHDDYTIMSMIEKELGVSILPKLVLSRSDYDIVTKEISPPIVRTISLAFKNKKVLPIASRYFMDFIVEQYGGLAHEEKPPLAE